jgi:hypothetical protein
MDAHSTYGPFQTKCKKAMRACLVILGSISFAQAALPTTNAL